MHGRGGVAQLAEEAALGGGGQGGAERVEVEGLGSGHRGAKGLSLDS